MKTLFLLRHAKSSWDDAVERDYDRPLNPRGRRAAAVMGRYLASEGLRFDRVIVSGARRTRETVETLIEAYGAPLAPLFDDRLYMASAATLLDVIHGVPASAQSLLLLGHNPGLEDLAMRLAGPDSDAGLRAALEVKYPTATLAALRTDTDDWARVEDGGCTLTRFVRPRDLDPSLGPDGS